MNRIVLLVLLLLLIQPATIAQEPLIYDGPPMLEGSFRAQDYLEMPPAQQQGYAEGFVDAMHEAPVLGSPPLDKVLVAMELCIDDFDATKADSKTGPKRMRALQLAAIIEKHIREHPEHWQESLQFEAWHALSEDACQLHLMVPDPKDRHLTPETRR